MNESIPVSIQMNISFDDSGGGDDDDNNDGGNGVVLIEDDDVMIDDDDVNSNTMNHDNSNNNNRAITIITSDSTAVVPSISNTIDIRDNNSNNHHQQQQQQGTRHTVNSGSSIMEQTEWNNDTISSSLLLLQQQQQQSEQENGIRTNDIIVDNNNNNNNNINNSNTTMISTYNSFDSNAPDDIVISPKSITTTYTSPTTTTSIFTTRDHTTTTTTNRNVSGVGSNNTTTGSNSSNFVLVPPSSLLMSTTGGNHKNTDQNNNNNKSKNNTVLSYEERKKLLVIEARNDRNRWIQQIALPYQNNTVITKNKDTTTIISTSANSTMHPTHATFHLPTIRTVVQYLYQKDHMMNYNNNNTSTTTTTTTTTIPSLSLSSSSAITTKIASTTNNNNINDNDDDDVVEQQLSQLALLKQVELDSKKYDNNNNINNYNNDEDDFCYPNNINSNNNNDNNNNNESILSSYRMSGLQLLQYEMEQFNQIATNTSNSNNINSANNNDTSNNVSNNITTTTDIQSNATILSIITSQEILHDYYIFLQLLLYDPNYIPFIHKIRKYIRQLYKQINDTSASSVSSSTMESIESMVSKFQHYMIDTMFDNDFVSLLHMSSISVSSSQKLIIVNNNNNTTNNNNNKNSNHNNNKIDYSNNCTDTNNTITTIIQRLRRCYESFIYGHTYTYFTMLFHRNDTNGTIQKQNIQFTTNLQFLSSFVSCHHLDIHCIVSLLEQQKQEKDTSMNDIDFEYNTLFPIFYKCIILLLSIDIYYSPYEKLQRILLLYREINTALNTIMNTKTSTGTSSSSTKPPSADDILPTFIYVIILAYKYHCLHYNKTNLKENELELPKKSFINLYYNLYYIEQLLSSPTSSNISGTTGITSTTATNHLRGEAGYAYTNLYSAYQFIYDFIPPTTTNTDIGGTSVLSETPLPSPPSSISISQVQWQNALVKYKEIVQEKFQQDTMEETKRNKALLVDTYDIDYNLALQEHMEEQGRRQLIDPNVTTTSTGYSTDTKNVVSSFPTPIDIRRARLNGEVVDLNWASTFQQQKDGQLCKLNETSPANISNANYVSNGNSYKSTIFEQVEDILPDGCHRNYNFIHVHNQDELKYNEVQELLNEYHMLVRTTETLLSERATIISKSRRAIQRKQYQELQFKYQHQQHDEHRF